MEKYIIFERRGQRKVFDDFRSCDESQLRVIKMVAAEMLEKSGFNTKLLGYCYVIKAVVLCYDEPDLLICKTKVLYPQIAEFYGVSVESVERNIHTAIQSAWKRCGGNNFYLRAGCKCVTDNRRPTCGELIDIITDYMTDNFK